MKPSREESDAVLRGVAAAPPRSPPAAHARRRQEPGDPVRPYGVPPRAAELNPTTEAGRAFLQERLSLFGRWFFLVSLAYYLIANLPLDLPMGYPFTWVNEYFGPQERIVLGIIGCAGFVWLATRRRPLSAAHLSLLDAFALIAPLALLGVAVLRATPPRGDIDMLFSILVGSIVLIIVRAITVPSSARRTLVLSSLGYAPVLAGTFYAMVAVTDLPFRGAFNMAMGAAVWGVIAVASASITSRILFRLRSKVAEVRRLGQYTLQEEIGRGGMGIVYRASHALLRRPTAIKLLAPEKNMQADLQRFEREVQLTASLTHPNTVAVYDYGHSPEGEFYYAMEYIDGISLEDLVDRYGPQPAWRVIHILRQVCGALEEAHCVGLIHRDIKPVNLMLCVRGAVPDVVKVLDFGLVKPLDTAKGAFPSAVDAVAGTPHYLPPEAIENPGSIDRRSDLYALGATGYFLLTGTTVFDGATVMAVCSKHLSEEPEPPSVRLGSPTAPDLEALLLRCLAKKPDQRPGSAGELAALLAGCEAAGEWSPARVDEWWGAFRTTAAPLAEPPARRTMEIDPRRPA